MSVESQRKYRQSCMSIVTSEAQTVVYVCRVTAEEQTVVYVCRVTAEEQTVVYVCRVTAEVQTVMYVYSHIRSTDSCVFVCTGTV